MLKKKQKKDPIKGLKKKADKSLQDSYRREYPYEKCESCGMPFNLMHHDIEKSNSLYGRWMCPANLIFLCSPCHQLIHFTNRIPVQRYTLKRGDKWLRGQVKIRQQGKPKLNKAILEGIIDYYNMGKPEKWKL